MPLLFLLLGALAGLAAPPGAHAMNPLHLKECEAQLLGDAQDDPFSIDYRAMRLEPGTTVENAFQRLFYTTLHQCDFCTVNVVEFLRFARSQGLDVSDARILVITSPGGEVRAKAVRGVGERHWLFHVVVVFRGRVLDFDFTNRPTILTLAEYRDRMFGPQANLALEYQVFR